MSELEQTKKVLDVIANLINEKETCTYRHLIYDLLEFKEDAYSELISGLTITNFLVYVEELEEEIERLHSIIKEVREYIEGNLENTSQTLRFDENKSYNTALLELKEILDKVSNNESN